MLTTCHFTSNDVIIDKKLHLDLGSALEFLFFHHVRKVTLIDSNVVKSYKMFYIKCKVYLVFTKVTVFLI